MVKNKKFIVNGMSCSNCSNLINKTLCNTKGINSCDVSVLTKEMHVEYDDDVIDAKEICSIVNKLGYKANQSDNKNVNRGLIKLIISIILLIILAYIANIKMFNLPSFGIFDNFYFNSITQFVLTFTIIIINFRFYKSGFQGIIKLSPNMDTLIMLSSFSAFVYSIVIMIFNLFNIPFNDSLNHLYFE